MAAGGVVTMPFPNTNIVPDGWAARHRPIVAGFFVDTVTIERRTGTTTRDSLGAETPVWAVIAEGIPALVQVNHTVSVDRRDNTGQPLVVADYYGRLDVEWLPQDGDRLTVTASPDPANLGVYMVARRESQGHVVDRTVHLERIY